MVVKRSRNTRTRPIGPALAAEMLFVRSGLSMPAAFRNGLLVSSIDG
jgi:hypothetical protein